MVESENKLNFASVENSRKKESESSDGEDNDDHDPHFEPLMQLPEVDIKTLEEDEEVLWKHRGQLYRYDDSEKPGQWKQRGTGVVKLLKHKARGYVRLLMRRDVTLKVCANHYILPNLELRKHDKSDRAWVWCTPADFADEEPKMETLAIRFKDAQTCDEFHSHFQKAKELMQEYQKKILNNSEVEQEEDDKRRAECDDEQGDEALIQEVKGLSVA